MACKDEKGFGEYHCCLLYTLQLSSKVPCRAVVSCAKYTVSQAVNRLTESGIRIIKSTVTLTIATAEMTDEAQCCVHHGLAGVPRLPQPACN